MFLRVLSVAGRLCVPLWLLSALISPAAAQTNSSKPPEKPPAAGQETAKEPQKIDEFAEAQRTLSGPAGNPECVWLGRRVVSLLWRDDLDTAFRHLDLYDRFGCPGGHIQATFRCLILHGNAIDPKAADSLNGRVHACWINPLMPPPPPPPAAAEPSPPPAIERSGARHRRRGREILGPGKPYAVLKKSCGTKVAVLNLPPRGATSSFTARRSPHRSILEPWGQVRPVFLAPLG